MLERFRQPSPEVHIPRLADALLIRGTTDGASGEPRSDSPSRSTALAAGLIHNAALSQRIILISDPEGLKLMREYLGDLGVSQRDMISQKRPQNLDGQARKIKRILRKHPEIEDIGLITPGTIDEGTKKAFVDLGLSLESISPEATVGERIAESMKNSPSAAKELLTQLFLKLVRARNALRPIAFNAITLGP